VGGNALSKARHFCSLAFPGLGVLFPWECKFSNKLVSLNLVKITARLEIQGPTAKFKRDHSFFQGGPWIFTVLTTLKLHFNFCQYGIVKFIIWSQSYPMCTSHSVMEGQQHNNPLNPRCFCLQLPKRDGTSS